MPKTHSGTMWSHICHFLLILGYGSTRLNSLWLKIAHALHGIFFWRVGQSRAIPWMKNSRTYLSTQKFGVLPTSANRGGNFCHRAPPIDSFWNFLISFFKGLGQAPLSPKVCQEHLVSSCLSADTINLEICPAVSSVIPKLSILAFHELYIDKEN